MAPFTDYHCHILPGIDDGADSAATSLQMVAMMRAQGIERICATPHFYAHRERSVADYLKKRQAAFETIQGQTAVTDIHLGAEVAIEHGISEMDGIERLAIEGTRIILLELPYRPYEPWMSEEIYNIAAEHRLKVMLAHVHRCLPYCSREQLEALLHSNAIYQLNNEAFARWREKRVAKKVITEHTHFAFGSDAHDTASRKPNWDLLVKKVKPDVVAVSNGMLERYGI